MECGTHSEGVHSGYIHWLVHHETGAGQVESVQSNISVMHCTMIQ